MSYTKRQLQEAWRVLDRYVGYMKVPYEEIWSDKRLVDLMLDNLSWLENVSDAAALLQFMYQNLRPLA